MESPNMKGSTAWVGVMFLLASATFESLSNEFVTLSGNEGIPGLQILFLNRLSLLIMVAAAWPIVRPTVTGLTGYKQIGLFLLVTASHNLEYALAFIALTFADPGIAHTIRKGTKTVLTAILGFYFLGEVLGLLDCFGIFLNFVGVAVIGYCLIFGRKPVRSNVLTFLLPTLAAAVGAPLTLLDKILIDMKEFHMLVLLLGISASGCLYLPALTYAFENPVWNMSVQTVGYLIGVNVTYTLAIVTWYCGIRLEDAGVSTAIKVITVPITIALDYFFLSKIPSTIKLVGGALAFAGSVIISVVTIRRHRKTEKRAELMEELGFDPPIEDK
ncbi:uncharacterized protein LOC118429902 [Branchiostoma floridae]|uniref:Uncharacterized protein LOC118429902 n=1 Tax=Branchiostoma floridae TaxID=7739 RepID=A0A9J7N7U0_BRAFL|nr:uncharacterized protein LOC118429902 [Branchiostoma floridae]